MFDAAAANGGGGDHGNDGDGSGSAGADAGGDEQVQGKWSGCAKWRGQEPP